MKTRLLLLPALLVATLSLAADPASPKPAAKPAVTPSPEKQTPPAKPEVKVNASAADTTAKKAAQQADEKRDAKNTRALFDGKTLGDWKIVDELSFKDHGKITAADGEIHLGHGDPYSGIVYGGKFPKTNYEIALEAKRTKGDDFFCGLTFPVGDSPLTLIVGGWGGSVVGFSNIDGMNASENTATHGMTFENDRWYKIRLRVTPENISLFIDQEQIIDLDTDEHKFDIYSSMESMRPLGLTTWNTGAAVRNLSVQTLPAKAAKGQASQPPNTDDKNSKPRNDK